MAPGGFLADPGYGGLAARHHSAGTSVTYDHLLRAESPRGPVDLVRYRFGPDPDNGRAVGCLGVTWAAGGGGMSCLDDGEMGEDQAGIIVGRNGSEELWALVLRGPDETTHFLIANPVEIVEIRAVDGLALFVTTEPVKCEFSYTVEAWSNDTLLQREATRAGCAIEWR